MASKIISLYETYKNTPKKLKIACGWDEVIQACEPFAIWEALYKTKIEDLGDDRIPFREFYSHYFWSKKDNNELELRNKFKIKYSSYGSSMELEEAGEDLRDNYPIVKNSPKFYQEAPFLTIAEDLLKLIREDKVEQLTFLSAYDKRVFPDGDERKLQIFIETFARFGKELEMWYGDKKLPIGRVPLYLAGEFVGDVPSDYNKGKNVSVVKLQLIPFKNETQGQTKADWIKENVSDFDLVIDDNPEICKSILNENSFGLCRNCRKENNLEKGDGVKTCSKCPKEFSRVCSPYYPAIKHDERVLLVKNEVSGLKKEDFNKNG